MKKLLVLLLILISFTTVYAAGSPSTRPSINQDTVEISGGNDGRTIRLDQLNNLDRVHDGDTVEDIWALLKKQVPGQELTKDLKDRLNANVSGAVLVGEGFYDLTIKEGNEEKELGVTLEFEIPEITNRTSQVYMVHYSYSRGFEVITADSFNTAKGTARFTLKDVSPVGFIVKYNQAYTPAKTGVDGMASNNGLAKYALLAAGVATVAVVVAKSKKSK